ncbi:MAG: hypothetical protein PHT69_10305 [Bacteroidales bacterium]|nr:hypothetical protein [Bacteroidales bacterium]
MKKKLKISFNLLTPVLFALINVLFLASACKKEKPLGTVEPEIFGFSFFSKIPGLWHGPVTSATPAGNFDNWYVDFRPVSASQVSHFSLLDANTVNNLSFFTVKHKGKLTLAMRTEGCFNNQCCITYEVLDSISEANGYYRFSDFVAGTNRAYTEFIFTNNQLQMKVYTNKFNTVAPLEPHSVWTAELGSRSNVVEATEHFNYPQPVMTKDFSNAFNFMSESIFFSFVNDPYKSEDQPYVGNVNVNISIDSSLTVTGTDKVFVLFTTESLFDGFIFNADNLKYISKYVLLPASTASYQIKNVHPGTYYIYAFIDKNYDNQFLSGDYMNSNVSQSFILLEEQNLEVYTLIDYIIP